MLEENVKNKMEINMIKVLNEKNENFVIFYWVCHVLKRNVKIIMEIIQQKNQNAKKMKCWKNYCIAPAIIKRNDNE